MRSIHEYLQKKEFINRQVYFYAKGKCTNELKYKIRRKRCSAKLIYNGIMHNENAWFDKRIVIFPNIRNFYNKMLYKMRNVVYNTVQRS